MAVDSLMERLVDLHVEWRHGETPGVYTVRLMTLFGALMRDVEDIMPNFIEMDCCKEKPDATTSSQTRRRTARRSGVSAPPSRK